MANRILALSVSRIILAAFATIVPVALVLILAHLAFDKSMRGLWPQVLAMIGCVAGYRFYVRVIEKRGMSELRLAGASRELGAGLLIGAALLLATIGVTAVAGAYHVTGVQSATVLVPSLAEMALVATFEEIVFRGILFRITERSLGKWVALILSSIIFAAAHLPNADISVLAIVFTFVAGVVLAAGYMATRSLWLPIGLHFAWNYLSEAVFSLATSGHPAKGLIQGGMSGPAWLTGGAYGVEASAISLALFAVAGVGLLAIAARRDPICENEDSASG
jgi:membrane protease YdiL (CAAX protease family)